MTTASRKTFSAGLSSETQSFTIDGLHCKNKKIPQYVLATIAFLERGLPTNLTKSLEIELGNLIGAGRYKAALQIMDDPLISDQECNWSDKIKGHDETARFPARAFYSEFLPEALSETPYRTQHFLPEVPISEIIPDLLPADGIAKGEAVDFFCPYFRLVVEIDGSQHQQDEIKIHDKSRNKVFNSRGINTARIPTSWIDKNSGYTDRLLNFFGKQEEATGYKIGTYSLGSEVYADKISIISAIRIQRVIIELVRTGQLSTHPDKWNINFLANDAVDIDCLEAGVEALIGLMRTFAAIYSERFKYPTRKAFLKPIDKTASLTIDYSATHIFDDNQIPINSIVARNNLLNHQYNITSKFPRDYTCTNGDFGKNISLNSKNKTAALERLLYEVYGYDTFQKGQYEIIQSSFESKAVLGLLPTGAGKSLTFQLPGLLTSGCTVVICPITALVRDHREELFEIGFAGRAEYISAEVPRQEKERILKKLSAGSLRYLFVSPEQFQKEEFRGFVRSAVEANVIAKIVIDEVHCLSEWGHDFRVAYLTLSNTLRAIAPSISVLCLTATASKSVMRDIQIEFEIDDQDIIYTMDQSRPNLNFDVLNTNEKISALKRKLHDMKNDSLVGTDNAAVIFVPTVNGMTGAYSILPIVRKELAPLKVGMFTGSAPNKWNPSAEVEKFSKLRETSGQSDFSDYSDYKQEVQGLFKSNKLSAIVATKAFGMGVNKPNIDNVIHFGMPGSIEALYQEAGRSGRKGQPANCLSIVEIMDDIPSVIFDPESSIVDLKKWTKSVKYGAGDIGTQMYFLSHSTKPINDDVQECMNLYRQLMKTARNPAVIRSKETIIYRLLQLGIVSDWTVENFFDGIYKIYWKETPQEVLGKNLIDLKLKYGSNDAEQADIISNINTILNSEQSTESVEDRLFSDLLKWNYSTFVSNRRTSLQNLVNAYREFDPSEPNRFKSILDSYFKVTKDNASVLDIIVAEPKNLASYTKKLLCNKSGARRSAQQRQDIGGAISRYMESHPNSLGLDLAYAMHELLDGNFFGQEGEQRFIRFLRSGNKLYDSNVFSELLKDIIIEFKAHVPEAFLDILVNEVDFIDLSRTIYEEFGNNAALARSITRINVDLEGVL